MKLVNNSVTKILVTLLLSSVSIAAFAAETGTISTIATTVTKEATAIAKLLSITAYVAGVGFALAGILQFKAHKEQPQQVPLSKPVVMIVVAACLLFLPTILDVAGGSLFGEGKQSAASAGEGTPLGE